MTKSFPRVLTSHEDGPAVRSYVATRVVGRDLWYACFYAFPLWERNALLFFGSLSGKAESRRSFFLVAARDGWGFAEICENPLLPFRFSERKNNTFDNGKDKNLITLRESGYRKLEKQTEISKLIEGNQEKSRFENSRNGSGSHRDVLGNIAGSHTLTSSDSCMQGKPFRRTRCQKQDRVMSYSVGHVGHPSMWEP